MKGYDQWKEDFLQEIRDRKETMNIDTDTYLITGVPFYNYDNENKFKEELEKTLQISNKAVRKHPHKVHIDY